MGRSVSVLARAALALAIAAAVATAAAPAGDVKCGGCTPCVGADCPVLYPSPPPPPPYFYYSPPPPATYPGGSSYCPPPPGAYIQIGSTPPGKGPLYPQDPGFMPAAAPGRDAAAAATITVLAALVATVGAFL